ncbi:MAG: monovalent cation/H(+) antiporter subunit G [Lachnospiraceae bacterium]|nr:monovalent cation/H(+) antiporter subunit G [Lachnospiraceae bacterium]
MTVAWIRFAFTAIFLLLSLLSFTTAVLGVYRFHFILNRIHAAGIGDTMGLFFLLLSMAISAPSLNHILKLSLICLFFWCSSPVSTHFISQMEFYTNKDIYSSIKRKDIPEESADRACRQKD